LAKAGECIKVNTVSEIM